MPNRPNAVTEQIDRELAVERRRSAERRDGADAAHLQREAADPVAEHADRVDHEVHRHRVRGVLGAGEPGLDHREAGLHEHDEEAGDQRPHDVDGDLVVADGVHHLGQRRILRVLDGHVLAVPVAAPVGSLFTWPIAPWACNAYGATKLPALNASNAVMTTLQRRFARLFISSPFLNPNVRRRPVMNNGSRADAEQTEIHRRRRAISRVL